MLMRRLFFILLLGWGGATGLRAAELPRPATPDEIALLNDAIKNTEQDPDHWAALNINSLIKIYKKLELLI